MKKFWIVLLCLLLLSGCGKARASISLQEQYAAVTEAELTAQITCHTWLLKILFFISGTVSTCL